MNVRELDLPANIIDALEERGFISLFPPQAEAVPKALRGENLVIAVSTASGKSLIGYIAALKTMLVHGRKVLYIVPLKALASEKRDELDEFAHLGFKVAMSTGDLDSGDRGLNDADIIVATSEKADSLLRHGSRWMDDVGLVIADEVHMIHEPERGPTLEVAITKMMSRNRGMQIIALSATISNAADLAEWLDAELVKSAWRPIELKEGVYFDGEIRYDNGVSEEISSVKDEIWSMISDAVRSGGQCLVFVNSRRSTESLAMKYSKDMRELSDVVLSDNDVSVLEGEGGSTSIGRKLAQCVSSGIAFHHAGLTYKQRKLVEDEFKNGSVKCIVATPTLAAGINIPARRVIIRDTKRFESNMGNVPIPVMEIKQMCGRAGRPKYDAYGEAVLIAKNRNDYEHLMNDYVMCDSEDIISKLGSENVLRSHILGLIATGDASSDGDIIDFIRKTFYGSRSQLYGIEGMVEKVTGFLIKEGMAETDDGTAEGTDMLAATPFGKRVSDLYIDPQSAVILKNALYRMKNDTGEFAMLHAVASTPDVLGFFPKKCDAERLKALAAEYEDELLVPVPDDDEYEYFLSDLKTAELMTDWINEVDEETITERLGIGPGDMRARVDASEWLMYAFIETALIFRPELAKMMRPLLTRIRYGVKEELSELVSLRGVGRARARILYNNGVKGKADIASSELSRLARIPGIGNSLAMRLKEQTGQSVQSAVYADGYAADDTDAGAPDDVRGIQAEQKQSRLFDF